MNNLDDAIALQKIRAYCEGILTSERKARTEWGAGYEECERDFAEGILRVINGEDK
jgi:Cys-tRNA synthase (O-phospho-L-seryl-tRNA:Cys-tRNA synthase)